MPCIYLHNRVKNVYLEMNIKWLFSRKISVNLSSTYYISSSLRHPRYGFLFFFLFFYLLTALFIQKLLLYLRWKLWMYSMDCVGVDYFYREIRCTLHFLLLKERKSHCVYIFSTITNWFHNSPPCLIPQKNHWVDKTAAFPDPSVTEGFSYYLTCFT